MIWIEHVGDICPLSACGTRAAGRGTRASRRGSSRMCSTASRRAARPRRPSPPWPWRTTGSTGGPTTLRRSQDAARRPTAHRSAGTPATKGTLETQHNCCTRRFKARTQCTPTGGCSCDWSCLLASAWLVPGLLPGARPCSQDLSNALWSLATARVERGLARDLAERAAQRGLDGFKAQETVPGRRAGLERSASTALTQRL